MTRPNFNDIQSFDEFKQYYWYRDELKQICKEHGITHTGTKTELNDNIRHLWILLGSVLHFLCIILYVI